jgi:predicted secreted hydrolase
MKGTSKWSFLAALLFLAADWQIAEPGWQYEFPRDHHFHQKFKTEWWYYTGNLTNSRGRRFGYELTFFRQGIRPAFAGSATTSRFVIDDLKFAHFAITDSTEKKFLAQANVSRGSFGEAGFGANDRLAWIDSWSVELNTDGSFNIAAETADASCKLHLVPQKPPVIHGQEGVSQKAEGSGHASHYYSNTRLATTGEVRVAKDNFEVTGDSWFDHEWATNQLAPGQAGWNWISAQFDDQTELMLYQMRLTNGGIDPISSGTFVNADGTAVFLPSENFRMTSDTFWQSPKTKANYPIGWRIAVPGERLEFTIRPIMPNQELALEPLVYWEGAFDLDGTHYGKPVRGHGYLELTGYAAPLQELNR